MARVQRGDGRALGALFERHRASVFGFLARRCGDAAAAEDLLQETWLRVVRGRASFDPSRRFATWLFQVANNLCRDRARRLAVEARRREGAMQSALAAGGERRAAPVELQLEIRERLARLPDRLREVLVLRYYHDLSEHEIAHIAGVPAGTVKSRLHAALSVLRGQARRGEERGGG